jgi:AP-3 complex subunit delta-1
MKIHPKAVAEHRDLVVNCLDDEDITIRLRALDLLEGMVIILSSLSNSLGY